MSEEKVVLVISPDPRHRRIYTIGLGKHFTLQFSPSVAGGPGRLDGVVYDIANVHDTIDLEWLRSTDVPVVVLTPEGVGFPLRDTTRRCVLTYPVTPFQIRDAMRRLWDEAAAPLMG